MLCVVGTPEVVIGHRKAASYREALTHLPPRPSAPDPTQLYPKRSADDEQRAVVEAKIGYYDLLYSAGRVLVLLGLGLGLLGVVWGPAPRPVPATEPETNP